MTALTLLVKMWVFISVSNYCYLNVNEGLYVRTSE